MAAKKKKSTSRAKRSRKSTRKQHRLTFWIIGGIVLLILFAFLSGNKSLITLYSLYETRRELIEQKEQLQKENEQLLKEIERLKHDLNYLEKVARENYNLKRDDEEVYQVVPKKKE